MKKYLCAAVATLCLFLFSTANYIHAADFSKHSGRTDAYGGHKDNKNKSKLGPYHYHCGGHPAHLHTGGKCPYRKR